MEKDIIRKRLLILIKRKAKEKNSKLFKQQMKQFKKETNSHKRSNTSASSNSIWALSIPMGGEVKWKRKK